MTGKMITFEGGEGSGKSTQVRLLHAALGDTALVTRQPGGTSIGQTVRSIVLDSPPGSVSDRAEALLYAADRAQHVDEVIRPALAAGTTVVCDRYVDSSLAYQAAGRGMDAAWVAELSRWATGGLVPDLTVLLDIDPAVGLERAGRRGAADRLEQESLDFHHRVRDCYRQLALYGGGRYLVLDATYPADDLAADIVARVRHLINTTTGVSA